MSQHERFTDDRFSESDANRTANLPTKNPPAGEPGIDPKQGDEISPGQPEIAGTGTGDEGGKGSSPANNSSER